MDPVTVICEAGQQLIVSTACVVATMTAGPAPTATPPPAPTAAATVAPTRLPIASPTIVAAPTVLPVPTGLPAGAVVDDFNAALTLEEGSPGHPRWRVTSGGRFYTGIGGTAQTIHGDLPVGDRWRTAYSGTATNRENTDSGLHPQNIFRLVGKMKLLNAKQSVRFRIDKTILSPAEQRYGSNGVLFFNRYQDGDHLYYAGIRVDGSLVIKKKNGPVSSGYTTLAQRKILPGSYNRSSFPQLIPQWAWHTLTSETENTPTGCVVITVKYDDHAPLSATDCNSPFKVAGFGGIRTDFMDVSFDDYVAVPR